MALVWISFLIFMIMSSASAACDRCLHQSKATQTSQIDPGGCGYGPLAFSFNGGLLAAGLPSLFQEGAGCGACFKVRCKNIVLCREEWTPIILINSQGDNRADFLLNKDAFSAMANNGKSQDLLNLGIVDIEYERVPCVYKNQNLAVQVESYSQWPNYLAILILYQGGQTRMEAVDIATVGQQGWTTLRHSFGAVWETNNVPPGPLRFGFRVAKGYNGSNYYTTQAVLPSNWKPGEIYDTGIQISDIAQENCNPCDRSTN